MEHNLQAADSTDSPPPPKRRRTQFGLKELAPGINPSVDIVAIHGIHGDRDDSWTAENGVLWLRDLLPAEIPNARILTYGYDTNARDQEGLATDFMHEHATNFVSKLAHLREISATVERPIIFVAHSSGGLLLKYALIHSHLSHDIHLRHHRAISQLTHGVSFFGTPHQGSATAELARFILDTGSHPTPTSTVLLRHLERDSEALQHQLMQYSAISGQFETKYFYERYDTQIAAISKRVVPRTSAVVPGTVNAEAIGISKDHFHMVKFPSVDDEDFRTVSRSLFLMSKAACQKMAEKEDRHKSTIKFGSSVALESGIVNESAAKAVTGNKAKIGQNINHPVASNNIAFQQWLRELHFFLPRHSNVVTTSDTPEHTGNINSSMGSLWTFHDDVDDIVESIRHSPKGSSLRKSSDGSQLRPALTELPKRSIETKIVEELEELYPRLSSPLNLLEDWKRSNIKLHPTNKPRAQLDHEAFLVFLKSGMEDAHYKWESRAYFDGLQERDDDITTLESQTPDGGQTDGRWWLLHLASYPSLYQISNEREVDRFMASCISGLFAAPDFNQSSVSQLDHPLSFSSLDNIAPTSIMAQMQLKGWEKSLFPIGFAAQRGKKDAAVLLANALQATLNMLILYFLSTRTSIDEMLPYWLYIYGIAYDNDGLIIFVHFPHLVEVAASSDAVSDHPIQRYWGYVSVMICNNYAENFNDHDPSNFNLAKALLVIRAHTLYLMEKLEQWKEYKDMNLLIECAKRRKRRGNT